MEGRFFYDGIVNRVKITGIPQYYYEKPPSESSGRCTRCKRLDILGGGLCKGCWDKALNSKIAQSRTGRENLGVEQEATHDNNHQGFTNGRRAWSKGLTKNDHPGLMSISQKMIGRRNRLGKKKHTDFPNHKTSID